MRSGSTTFHVVDLSKSLRLYEAPLPGEPISVRCSTKSFTFVIRTELSFYEIFIYYWDGIAAFPSSITLPQHRETVAMTYPQLSSNGVLAYRPGYKERVDFYDTHAVGLFIEMLAFYTFRKKNSFVISSMTLNSRHAYDSSRLVDIHFLIS